jgi:hypothetical protein
MKTFRLKAGAPPHYVQGRGLLGPGDTYQAAEPMSIFSEEVEAKPAAKVEKVAKVEKADK